MRNRSILVCCAIIAVSAAGFAADRTIEASFPADQFEAISVTNGVGDFGFAAGDSSDIRVQITLTPRRGGLFSSMKRAEEDVEKATLISNIDDRTLFLEVDAGSSEPRFEAHWRVTAPSRLALDLEQGVGDVDVTGSAGDIEMEVGVGTASVTVLGGNVSVNVGVGNGRVRGPAGAFRSADAAGGVGDAVIEAESDVENSAGFVSHSSSWRGDGTYTIELEVGVGDAKIILD